MHYIKKWTWLAILLLAACTSTVRDEPGAVSDGTDSGSADVSENTDTQQGRSTPTNTISEPGSGSESNILTTDDRSASLKAATSSWNTNWNIHLVDYQKVRSGGPPRDGIPSVDDPQFVTPESASNWVADNEPVIAIEINGDARAYPLQVITWHEIVNDEIGGVPATITFCPLCNSAIVFDRRLNGETYEFGVSGLLHNSDLIMYDRTNESLWQQFTGQAIVGDLTGEQLTMLPSSIVSFANFRDAFPEGKVMSTDTGYSRAYGQNPYAGYDTIGQNPFLFDGAIDARLPGMARVVTVPLGEVDVAYPVDLLSELGVIHDQQGGQDMVLFHIDGTSSALGAAQISNGDDVGATGVFDPHVDGQTLTFYREGELLMDNETSSTWNILGQAIDGPLAGETLTPIVHADHFWFSWAAFKPDTILYNGS